MWASWQEKFILQLSWIQYHANCPEELYVFLTFMVFDNSLLDSILLKKAINTNPNWWLQAGIWILKVESKSGYTSIASCAINSLALVSHEVSCWGFHVLYLWTFVVHFSSFEFVKGARNLLHFSHISRSFLYHVA